MRLAGVLAEPVRLAIGIPAALLADALVGRDEGRSIGEVTAGMRPPAPAGWEWRSDGLLHPRRTR